MAATIARSYCRLRLCSNGMKHLQLCSAVPSKVYNPTVIKDIHRSAWYRSFFKSDQTSSLDKETVDSEITPDAGPSKPKIPPTSFVIYMQSIQENIKQSNLDFGRRNIISEASRRWRELDPEEKSKFAMKRKELYEKYKTDKQYYEDNMTPEQVDREKKEKEKKEKRKLKKARKELGMPSKPMTAFAMFLADLYHEGPKEGIIIFTKVVKEKWDQLSDHERDVYFAKSLEVRKQYQEEIAIWEESMIEAGRFDLIRKKTAKALKKESRKRSKVKEST